MSATGEILSKTAPKLSVTPISDHWNIRKTMKKFQKSERINSPSSFMQKNSTNKKGYKKFEINYFNYSRCSILSSLSSRREPGIDNDNDLY